MSDNTTTTECAPVAPSIAAPVLPGAADPTLFPQHTNFQVVEPILKESLDRVDAIALRAKNATDVLMEKHPHEAQKFMFHELRAEKLRLDIISKYTEMALEARKVVSTDKPLDKNTQGTQILNQGNLFLGPGIPPEFEQLAIEILGRKQAAGNTSDVSTSSLNI